MIVSFLLGDAKLEYVALCFNHDKYLVGLSGVPDNLLTLWNWKEGVKLHSQPTSIRVMNERKNLFKDILLKISFYLFQGPTNLSFCPNAGIKAPKFLLTETFNGPLVSLLHTNWKLVFCHSDFT